MNLDWRRLQAVVLESDDWGLCAWSPDEQAFRALSDGPAFRSPAGRRYGRSTLETADDVRRLTETLGAYRGADGVTPVWQANTVMAAPDFAAMSAPFFEAPLVPLVDFPSAPHRWDRPGLWDEVRAAIDAGTWWPELHGLHHLPESAWLAALRCGAPDARRGHEHQCLVCEAVEGSGEYDPAEPAADRDRRLAAAAERFQRVFGRAPGSICPPDYRWDERLESEAARHGIGVLQGKAEQAGAALPAVRRLVRRVRWPESAGALFCMPPRIAFEPCGPDQALDRVGPAAVVRRVREAWSLGRPAVVSTHRVNYAHLDPAWSERGRAALRDVLDALATAGARFLTDLEVRDLHTRGWSARALGRDATLVRHQGVPREPLRFAAPAGAAGVSVRESDAAAEVTLDGGEAEVRMNLGTCVLDWRRR